MDQHASDSANTNRDSTRRKSSDRRADANERRTQNVPVVMERRAASDRREFERRTGRDRRDDPWPA